LLKSIQKWLHNNFWKKYGFYSYKHNEQINNQNIDNSECLGVKFVKIYLEMTFLLKYGFGKHNEQINSQNIDNSECLGVTFVKIYPEMTSQ
jgi:hypothetical protein